MPRPRITANWVWRTLVIAIGATLMLTVATVVMRLDGAVPDPAVARVYLLPAGGERTSVVLDLVDDPVGMPAVRSADGLSLTVEIGVTNGPVSAGTLRTRSPSGMVRQVALAPGAGTREQVLQVQVATRVPVKGSIRRSLKRIYIDLTPLSNARGPATEPKPAPPAPVPVPVRRTPQAPVPPAASPAPRQPSSKAMTDVEVMQRAGELAQRSDIRGLERLRSEVASQPSPPEPVLAALDQYLDDARQRRLRSDSRALRASQNADYRSVVQQYIPEIQRIRTMLAGTFDETQPPPPFHGSISAILAGFCPLTPSNDLAEAHRRVCATLDSLNQVWNSSVGDNDALARRTSARALIASARSALQAYLTAAGSAE